MSQKPAGICSTVESFHHSSLSSLFVVQPLQCYRSTRPLPVVQPGGRWIQPVGRFSSSRSLLGGQEPLQAARWTPPGRLCPQIPGCCRTHWVSGRSHLGRRTSRLKQLYIYIFFKYFHFHNLN